MSDTSGIDVGGTMSTGVTEGDELEHTDGKHTYDGMCSNMMTVDGKQRIRKFTASYLDAGYWPVEYVIEELPSLVTSYDPNNSRHGGRLTRMDSDGIMTNDASSTASGNKRKGNNVTETTGVKVRRVNAVKKQKATVETIQKGFDYIRVHATGKRLGSFKQELEFAPADPVVMEYLLTDEGMVPGFEPLNNCFMMSCGEVQMAHLKMYDLPIVKGPCFDKLDEPEAGRIALERALDWVQDVLELPIKLPELEDLSVDDVRFNPMKSAGAYYRLQGYKRRGEVADQAREEARLVVSALLMGNTCGHRPTRIGGRGKAVKMSKQEAVNQKVRKGRAIHMTDTRDGFVLGMTEQPLNNAWKAKHYPVSVGRGWFHGDATDFVNRTMWADTVKLYDAEKFDSSLMPYLIHFAVTVCRGQFNNGYSTNHDEYWLFVEESLLHSFVYRDDGVLFEKWIGTSSGHNYNSLLQSIVTLILGAFNAFYINREKSALFVRGHFHLEALGDDNIFAQSKELKAESVEDAGRRIWNVFGVSWLGDKSFETNLMCENYVGDEDWVEADMFGTAQYLGKYFRNYPLVEQEGVIRYTAIPYRPWTETVIRLLYPEKAARTALSDDSMDVYGDGRGGRWAGHAMDGFGNPKTRNWLLGLRDYCLMNGYEIDNVDSKKLKARWERMCVDVETERLDWDTFRFLDWLGIVAYDKAGEPVLLEKTTDM
jgi:hypothetical protein